MAAATIHGTCHHDCPDSCGWTVTVEDGVAVKLRGRVDHPYSAGELCPKVNRFLDRVYSPDRILQPLRRIGPKGTGEFAPITWDEALAEIADRLHAVIDARGPEAILPYSDAGNQSLLSMMGMDGRFFHALGASRVVRAICGPTVGHGMRMTNGSGLGLDPLELRHSKLILIWGSNTRLTNRHLWPTIEAARADGAKVVVIDPIRTLTAEAADEFVQPLPGTDIALMLAMMHVLVRDDLVDRAWVDAHTVGYPELVDHVADWTPARAAAICGLDEPVIERLAHDWGTIRPAAIRTLIGAEHHENGAMFHRTLAVLPALVGAWQDRGGGLARSVGSYHDALIDEGAISGLDLLPGPLPRAINMSRLGEALTDPTMDPPVDALVVWNCNPLATTPNTELIRAGMARDDLFTVVHEQFLTDTARYADIVLPATTQLETTDVVPAWGHLWMGWNEAAIAPLGEACSNTELFRRLARAMGMHDPALHASDEALLEQALGQKVDLDELRRVGWLKVPYPEDGRAWGAGVFPTPSGPRRAGQRAADRDGPAGAADVRRPARGPARRSGPARSVPAAADDAQAPHPLPELRLQPAAQARASRGRTVRRARPGRRRSPGPRRRRPGAGLERSGHRHRAGARDRPGPARRRGHPVRLVERPPPRRPSRQLAHQRHPHRLGWRRRLQRHARADRHGLTSRSLTCP